MRTHGYPSENLVTFLEVGPVRIDDDTRNIIFSGMGTPYQSIGQQPHCLVATISIGNEYALTQRTQAAARTLG